MFLTSLTRSLIPAFTAAAVDKKAVNVVTVVVLAAAAV